jgi:hypothetical protein
MALWLRKRPRDSALSAPKHGRQQVPKRNEGTDQQDQREQHVLEDLGAHWLTASAI